jgi:hypothetical protein
MPDAPLPLRRASVADMQRFCATLNRHSEPFGVRLSLCKDGSLNAAR